MVLTLCILVLLSSPLYFVAKEAQEEVMDSAVAEEAPQQDEMVESGQLPLVSAPEGISLQERKVCLSNLLIAAVRRMLAA